MESVNYLHFMWLFYSFIVTVMGLNVLYCDDLLPEFLSRIYRFGKSRNHFLKKSFVSYFEIPKRWFTHFYIFATVYFLILNLEVWRRYFAGSSTKILDVMLDHCTTRNRFSTIAPESVLVLMFLLLLQASRRCYECLYVSVFSDAKMNLTHYIVGITFYFGAGLSVLSEAPGFARSNGYSDNKGVVQFSQSWLSLMHLSGILLFLVGFVIQFNAHIALANLRKDDKGKKVVTLKHVMPTGGMFNYVSCPHYMGEIIMYLSANLIMDGRNVTWWLVSLWVVSNQVMTALLSHEWYKKAFKDYPKRRRAVFPGLL